MWNFGGKRRMQENDSCTVDSDCSGESAFFVCSDATSKCVHKELFPMLAKEISGTLVLTIMMMLAVVSGIGGGGIVVPLLMIFYELNTKVAVSVSGFTILLGSISRYLTTFKNRHPDKDATTIEYSITNLMLPTVLVGSITGVFINILFPALILQVLLCILLLCLAYLAMVKA